jgi:hypothetical protein
VAIKVLPPQLARDSDFVRRFHVEATAVASLSHPNVVPVYFIGEDSGYHFFAMQYVEGESLAERLSRQKRLPVDEALKLIGQCLTGLQAAHGRGLIHRDVKPANILLERQSGRAMLVDFGLVRRLGQNAAMTSTGVILGTVDYIAPEQGRGLPVDSRTDIYAAGVLLYQLLSGQLPFVADTPTAMVFQHVYEKPFPLNEAIPGLPPPVVHIVERMMEKAPEHRYPDCAAVLADIRAYRQGRPLSPATQQAAALAATPGTNTKLDANVAGGVAEPPKPPPLPQQTTTRLPAAEAGQELEVGTAPPRSRLWMWGVAAAILLAVILPFLLTRRSQPPLGRLVEMPQGMPALPARQEQPPAKALPPGTPGNVVEGVGWGAFRVGATRDELVKAFGPPDANPNPQDQHVLWRSKCHVDCLFGAGRGAFEVRFSQGFELPLASGVHIGSAESEVLSAYGLPDRVVNHAGQKMLQYGTRGVLMWIRQGRVDNFTVFQPVAPSPTPDPAAASRRAKEQIKAHARMAQDRANFSAEELAEMESLTATADEQFGSERAWKAMKTLVAKYTNANRTGCALLYLGQMSRDEEKISYFKQAIADYSDCFYGDGVQVGAFARFLLGQAYLHNGEAAKATALFDEIRTSYPDSIDHSGRSLLPLLPSAVPSSPHR